MARLQMEIVVGANSRGSLLRALSSLPSGLHDMYRSTIERIDRQPEEDITIAQRALTWVLRAREPLTSHSLQIALAISPDQLRFDGEALMPIDLILGTCGGLLTLHVQTVGVPGGIPREIVRFVREFTPTFSLAFIPQDCDKSTILPDYTVHEYLESKTFAKVPRPEAYIAVVLFIHLIDIKLAGADVQLMPFEPLISESFAQYTTSHWGKHAFLSQDEGPLHPFILSFFYHPKNLFKYCRVIPEQTLAMTPLHMAARHGLIQVITSGRIPFVRCSNGETALHEAVRYLRVDSITALLATYRVVTPLAETSWMIPKEMMGFLSAEGYPEPEVDVSCVAPVNVQNYYGGSALSLSINLPEVKFPRDQQLKEEIFMLLLQVPGIDIHLKDCLGATVFWDACSRRFPTVEPALELTTAFPDLEVDICVSLEDEPSATVFMTACDRGNIAVVDWFLRRECPSDPKFLWQTDSDGFTALMRLCGGGRRYRNHSLIIKRLLEYDPTILHQRHCKGQRPTAFMIAAEQARADLIPVFFECPGFDINDRDDLDTTALMHAFRKLDMEMDHRALLMQHPLVDVKATNQVGDNALAIACSRPAGLPILDVEMLLQKADYEPCFIYRTITKNLVLDRTNERANPVLFQCLLSHVARTETFEERMGFSEAIFLLLKTKEQRCLVYIRLMLNHFGLLDFPQASTLQYGSCVCRGCLTVEDDPRAVFYKEEHASHPLGKPFSFDSWDPDCPKAMERDLENSNGVLGLLHDAFA